ncbi:hypothetical protein K523DRAFT_261395 [Schizophyllum commune Tattone D]|nr:hypothetical protein K523DRAFT_261395 [Schizophyllum commune Tattone D]
MTHSGPDDRITYACVHPTPLRLVFSLLFLPLVLVAISGVSPCSVIRFAICSLQRYSNTFFPNPLHVALFLAAVHFPLIAVHTYTGLKAIAMLS